MKKNDKELPNVFLLELFGAGSVPGFLIQRATLHLKMEILRSIG